MPSLNAGFNGGIPKAKLSLKSSSTLVKATLIPWEPGVPQIEFMFNPTELTFDCAVDVQESKGSQTETEGQPKSNVASTQAEKVTIGKILFDTYEDGDNVVEKYIEPFRAAVHFIGSSDQASLVALKGLPSPLKDAVAAPINSLSSSIQKGIDKATGNSSPSEEQKKSTPTYRFIWGDQTYLRRCKVEKLVYKLTMFLPDGTPVRAVIDNLSLKKVDEKKPGENLKASIIDRVKDGLQARLSVKGSFKV